MKINEVEALTGVSRANIRYYEKEGLLKIERKSNGYREYGEEDVARLRKIIIFRKLGLSVQTVHELLDGRLALSDALDENIASLEEQIEQLQGALQISRRMRSEGAAADALDEEYYLRIIREKEAAGNRFTDACRDFAQAERDMIARNLFFSLFAALKERVGTIGALIAMVAVCVLRGLVSEFVWGNGFWQGALGPAIMFAVGTVFIFVMSLLGRFFPRIFNILMWVLVIAILLFFALIAFAMVYGIIMHAAGIWPQAG